MFGASERTGLTAAEKAGEKLREMRQSHGLGWLGFWWRAFVSS